MSEKPLELLNLLLNRNIKHKVFPWGAGGPSLTFIIIHIHIILILASQGVVHLPALVGLVCAWFALVAQGGGSVTVHWIPRLVFVYDV